MISQKINGPIKLPGRALNDDGQMICKDVIITLSKSANGFPSEMTAAGELRCIDYAVASVVK